MPSLPTSKSFRGKNGRSASSNTIENLKLQHAEEIARTNDEHAKQVEKLEKEVDQCRAEIEALKAVSDEHADTLMPLPCPSTSLKFVKNTSTRKSRKGMGGGGANAGGSSRKNVASIVADIKAEHKKDIAKAAEIYSTKLKTFKKEVEGYKAEIEKLKSSGVRHGHSLDGANAHLKRGVAADNDKENVVQHQGWKANNSGTQSVHNRGEVTLEVKKGQHQKKDGGSDIACKNLDELDFNLRDKYKRLFLEEYRFEEDPVYKKFDSFEKDLDENVKLSQEINDMCEDLDDFMTDIRIKTCLGGF